MSPNDYLLIIFVGIFAGFLNTVAGGGSLISLPVLIFLGLPAAIANGTNRVAILIQNISGVASFHTSGRSSYKFSTIMAIPAMIGAFVGARLAIDIDESIFRKILAGIMIGVLVITLLPQQTKASLESLTSRQNYTPFQWAALVTSFFFIGIYGGFIQAGVGFIMLMVLTNVARLDLVNANAVKVFVVLFYTVLAVIVFAIENQINWLVGGTLAVGNAAGAWLGGKFAVAKGNKWLRVILILTVSAFALKLFFS